VRTIVISGSASGIGAATRALLEADGHRVIGIDLRDAEVVADLSTDAGRQTAVEETLDRCDGVLDGLVPGAGLGPPVEAGLIAEVNYFGSEALLEGLRPALAAGDRPAVVQIGSNSTTLTPNLPDELVDAFLAADRGTIASVLDDVGPPFDAAVAYGGSKTAITRWCRRHATTDAWVGAGIRLNVIAPGAVQTPLLKGGDDDPTFGPLTSALPVPTGRGEPADIAAWIAFMLSPAARFACGSVVFVDGGSDALIRTDDWPRTFTA
jgi:NAD(P)-dependent dehydrogenase (short-subunit alcohol dehydrogenase family)